MMPLSIFLNHPSYKFTLRNIHIGTNWLISLHWDSLVHPLWAKPVDAAPTRLSTPSVLYFDNFFFCFTCGFSLWSWPQSLIYPYLQIVPPSIALITIPWAVQSRTHADSRTIVLIRFKRAHAFCPLSDYNVFFFTFLVVEQTFLVVEQTDYETPRIVTLFHTCTGVLFPSTARNQNTMKILPSYNFFIY